jgi:hypothetical protein
VPATTATTPSQPPIAPTSIRASPDDDYDDHDADSDPPKKEFAGLFAAS